MNHINIIFLEKCILFKMSHLFFKTFYPETDTYLLERHFELNNL